MLGLWIYSAFNYYVIGYYVKYFPGDIFVNFLTMTIAEVISPIVLRIIQKYWITKYVYKYLLIMCCIISLGFMANQRWGSATYIPALILGIRICVKGIYSLGYFANGTLFPTLVKTSIFSLTNGVGRPFSALATMVVEYTKHPGEIFLGTSLLFLGTCHLMPDSDHTEQELEKIQESTRRLKEAQ